MKNTSYPLLSIFMIVLMAITLSCSKEQTERECNLSGTVGNWIWIESTGGVSGAHLTPDNTGLTMMLEINDTLWTEYLNDSITFSSPYTFTPDTNSTFLQGKVYFSLPPSLQIQIQNCSMTIEGHFEDGMDSTYEYTE